MTIAAETPTTTKVFTGPGEYTFSNFTVYDEDTVKVYHRDTSGVENLLVLTDDYTVTLNESTIGGHVDVTTEDYTGGYLVIVRELPYEQNLDLVGQGKFDPATLERGLDEAVMRDQQLRADLTESQSVFTWRGTWATATQYTSKDLVEGPSGDWYYCTQSHLSGVFNTDLASSLWAVLLNRANLLDMVAAAAASEEDAEAAAIAAQDAQTAAESAAENIVAVWADDPTSYDIPDLAVGSDGYTYRCIGTGVVGEDPTTDDGTYWVRLNGPFDLVPAGIITAFIGGYFTNGANAGFTNAIGDTASAVNTLLNASGWYVCDGAALNLSGSPIFDGASRYLPNLSDSRFLMGSTGAGAIGGATSSAHTHTTGSFTLTTNEMPSHSHGVPKSSGSGSTDNTSVSLSPNSVSGYYNILSSSGGGASHNHGTTGAASAAENRPLFLSCHYIMKVI